MYDGTVIIARTVLYPGEMTYVWSPDYQRLPEGMTTFPALFYRADPPTVSWRLHNASTTVNLKVVTPAVRGHLATEDPRFHLGLLVPSDAATGTYDLQNNSATAGFDTVGTVEIESLPTVKNPKVLFATGVDLTDALEDALADGDVVLSGGTYLLTHPIDCPSGRTIRGFGATLLRSWDTTEDPEDQFATPYFHFAGEGTAADRRRITFEGITFAAPRRPYGVLDTDTVALITAGGVSASPGVLENFTLRRCVFRNVQLGAWDKPGFWAEDCGWEEGGGCGYMTGRFGDTSGGALWLRCAFRGVADGDFIWLARGGTDARGSGMALLDCDFIATERGPFFQANLSNIEYNLITGLVCDRIGELYNECEGIGVEGLTTYEFRKNLIFHYRYRGEGPAIAFSYNANSNYIWDFVFDGGNGIAMYGPDGTEQKENTFEQGEIRGAFAAFRALPLPTRPIKIT